MRATRNVRDHAFSGSLVQAVDFFRATLPADGWHLVQLGGDGEHSQQQVWESARGRVVVRLQAALGSTAATRIRLSASAPPEVGTPSCRERVRREGEVPAVAG